jgi:hypothetical protein
VYNGKSYGITGVSLDLQPKPEGTCGVLIATDRGDIIRITLPLNFLDGNAHGFSHSPDLYIEYDGQVYSKASGYSGTVTVGKDENIIKIEATNYDNLKIIYEGPYETVS